MTIGQAVWRNAETKSSCARWCGNRSAIQPPGAVRKKPQKVPMVPVKASAV